MNALTKTNGPTCSERRHMSARAFKTYDAMRSCTGNNLPRQYWAGLAKLANLNNTSTATEARGIEELLADGWIIDLGRKREKGHLLEAVYQVLDHDEWLAADPSGECPTDKYVKGSDGKYVPADPKGAPVAFRQFNVTRMLAAFAERLSAIVARREEREAAGEVVAPVPPSEERARIIQRFTSDEPSAQPCALEPSAQDCGIGDEPSAQDCGSLARKAAEPSAQSCGSLARKAAEAYRASLREPLALQSLKESKQTSVIDSLTDGQSSKPAGLFDSSEATRAERKKLRDDEEAAKRTRWKKFINIGADEDNPLTDVMRYADPTTAERDAVLKQIDSMGHRSEEQNMLELTEAIDEWEEVFTPPVSTVHFHRWGKWLEHGEGKLKEHQQEA